MKIVLQRSGQSQVTVNESAVGSIKFGMVLLVCMEKGDSQTTIEEAAKKILALRIFEDDQGKMNLSILDVKGEVLAISQFTLSWDGKKGNRPSFDRSMPPSEAKEMFDRFCQILQQQVKIEKGEFGAAMHVQISNLGPVTFSLSF